MYEPVFGTQDQQHFILFQVTLQIKDVGYLEEVDAK